MRFRVIERFRHHNPSELFEEKVSLQEAQHVLAMEYGFRDWQEIRERITNASSAAQSPSAKRLLDVPPFTPQEDCGWLRYFGALTSVMRCYGEDVDYAYLNGISAAAFRLRVKVDDWCPSAQCPEGIRDFAYPKQALRSLGYRGEFLRPQEMANRDSAVAFRKWIDEGIPIHVTGSEVDVAPDFSSVVAGYGEGDRFIVMKYAADDFDAAPATKLAGSLLIVRENGDPLPPSQAVKESFQIALAIANTPEIDGYALGHTAFELWVKRLIDMESRYADMGSEDLQGEWWRCAMVYEGLCDARGAAKRYLLGAQEELPNASAEELQPLVEKYSEIQKLVFENWKWFPFPHWVQETAGKIWTPLGMIDGTTWSPEIREKEIQAIERIREAEKEAIDLMAEFLEKIS